MAAATVFGVPGSLWTPYLFAAEGDKTKYRRIPTQFIAARADPGANSGTGAQTWGLWPLDPGPRGVRLDQYQKLVKAGGVAPAGWKFDNKDWWLEEHGLIMEQPTFPLAPLQYLVTGDRAVTTSLVIHPADKSGVSRWGLGDKATMHDVTHLGCRAARFTPRAGVSAACGSGRVHGGSRVRAARASAGDGTHAGGIGMSRRRGAAAAQCEAGQANTPQRTPRCITQCG